MAFRQYLTISFLIALFQMNNQHIIPLDLLNNTKIPYNYFIFNPNRQQLCSPGFSILFSSSTSLATLPPTFSEMAPVRSFIVRYLTDLAVPGQVFEVFAYSFSSKYFQFLLSGKTGNLGRGGPTLFFQYLQARYVQNRI